MKDCRGAFEAAAAVRESRGLALKDIARATNISVSYLRAIERGELERLPGGIYTISYIRQYAQAIEFDEQQLLRACGYKPPERTLDRSPAPSNRLRADLGAALRRLWELLSGEPAR